MNRIILITSIFYCLSASAQCDGRFITEIFDSVKVSTVQYSNVYNLDIDVYQPYSDTMQERPLIILGHGGAFYTGSKGNLTIVELCTDLAKHGYVCASLQYRLASSVLDLVDSMNAIDIVVKAISDGKAAVRFFRKSYINGNPYKIDSSQIYGGGNSAGGVLFAHLAVIDPGEIPAHVEAAFNNNGGFEGNSGNPGYNSQIKAVINLAGGINKKDWIDASDPPIVSCHGTKDKTVPYKCGDPLKSFTQGLIDIVDLCGGGKMQERIDMIGGTGALRTFWKQDHVPWSVDIGDYQLMFDFVRDFLYQSLDCSGGNITLKSDTVNYIEDSTNAVDYIEKGSINLYPNPATDLFNIEIKGGSADQDLILKLLTLQGREILNEETKVRYNATIDVSGLKAGLYILKAKGRNIYSEQILIISH